MSELQKYIEDRTDDAYNAVRFNSAGSVDWQAARDWAEKEALSHIEIDVEEEKRQC